MYTVVYSLYFILKRKQRKDKEGGKKPNILLKRLLDYVEWFYNIPVRSWYTKHPSQKCGINRTKREQKIIISLTSYPKRISTIWLTIETLLRQSVKPDEVILWLAESQFEGLSSLPKELLCMQQRGLTIRFCDDLRSHKKYFYVMQEHPDDLVVLADDDMFYPYDTVRKLLRMHEKYPNDVCTITAQVMSPDFTSLPSGWRTPKLSERFEHSNTIQIFSGSGSLYPPGALDRRVFDRLMIEKLCPYADDLWLTFMAYQNGTRITSLYPWRAFPVTIYGTGKESLYYVNADGGKNDEQWEGMLGHLMGE